MDISLEQRRLFLQVALHAIGKARPFIQDKVREGFSVQTKADNTFVTEVDRGVEKIIRETIQREFPNHSITGEELGVLNPDSDFKWYIDPIDGTINFVHGIPLYGTIVGLHYKGKPLVGVIEHTGLNLCYYAGLGLGAFCNDQRIKIEDVETASKIKEEIIATCPPSSFRETGTLDKYEKLYTSHPEVRNISDCFGHTLAARGAVGALVDYYLFSWDLAATQVLVEEAGGKFILAFEKPDQLGRKAYGIICGKPKVVDWVYNLLK